jgi:trimeric autotransporter adhesin
VKPGHTRKFSYTISNSGEVAVNITGVTITGANSKDFSVITPPASSIAAGGSTTFTIRFKPAGRGVRRARVLIHNDSDNSPYDFAIQSTGTVRH